MEISVIQSRTYSTNLVPLKTNFSAELELGKVKPGKAEMHVDLNRTALKLNVTRTNYTYLENLSIWNTSDFYYNVSNSTELDYDYQMMNGTIDDASWATCKEWTPAQHSLFQTANFFFAAAFLVPGSFKQSVLLVRALLSFGYFFLAIWGGVEVCAPDILLWNLIIVLLNCTHTALLIWRFLPPTLTLELTDLYIKIFKPLRVSKKHFKELVREAKVQTLECGDIYAVEDVSPADERLSILLKGRLRVTCDDTHLHFINQHQFVDSPEWEANHEQSDDVFQVTITAEEDCTYLCWSRMKLERVLRHRPMLKTVLDCVIGKDITQKLYALNEHLSGLSEERSRGKRNALWAKTNSRSMSMDAVNTGTTGLVRSQAYKSATANNNRSSNANCFSPNLGSTSRLQTSKPQTWVPLVATQFPKKSPFIQQNSTTSLRIPEVHSTPPLQRTKSVKGPKKEREVKFKAPLK
ncbi:blood vessel epicardial substance-B-like [Anthonomus grandis grandis]|uniref:blood vessel epicardial substance-B-like n=1 Tax=Anthonomus grandis grandis TaxID=2921223 RepID=UPI002166320D|nr:blood vessel epicardial substance-B-like [Anthonomus grandis grandis]